MPGAGFRMKVGKGQRMPSAYVYFRVAGNDLPLADITSMLGIDPTDSWNRGDPSKYNPSRPDSGWCLRARAQLRAERQ
ncbi:DUF4279 domain-containing protein [Roseateles asaccharophilus]|uniref:DUF4279 domain-containing protein n=1 Tax=Roseateles asaccharophilus TaxID=582607 RepID=UPI003851354E